MWEDTCACRLEGDGGGAEKGCWYGMEVRQNGADWGGGATRDEGREEKLKYKGDVPIYPSDSASVEARRRYTRTLLGGKHFDESRLISFKPFGQANRCPFIKTKTRRILRSLTIKLTVEFQAAGFAVPSFVYIFSPHGTTRIQTL